MPRFFNGSPYSFIDFQFGFFMVEDWKRLEIEGMMILDIKSIDLTSISQLTSKNPKILNKPHSNPDKKRSKKQKSKESQKTLKPVKWDS